MSSSAGAIEIEWPNWPDAPTDNTPDVLCNDFDHTCMLFSQIDISNKIQGFAIAYNMFKIFSGSRSLCYAV